MGSRRAPATGAAGPPRTRLDGPGGDRRDRRAGLRDPQHSRKKSTCERRGGSFSFALSNVCTYPAGSPYARGCSRGGCLAHASFSRPLDARSSATNDGVTRWARSQRHRPLLLPGRAGARGASVERSVFLIVGSVAETAGTRSSGSRQFNCAGANRRDAAAIRRALPAMSTAPQLLPHALASSRRAYDAAHRRSRIHGGRRRSWRAIRTVVGRRLLETS